MYEHELTTSTSTYYTILHIRHTQSMNNRKDNKTTFTWAMDIQYFYNEKIGSYLFIKN